MKNLAFAIAAFLLFLLPNSSADSAERPNIILISIDTLRADHLSCYGYHRNTTPNIDIFAKDAALFQNAISQSPLTTPAHMSIFTSLTPNVHKVATIRSYRFFRRLDEHIETLPMILKENGYLTFGLHGGAELTGSLGFDKGFDVYRQWGGYDQWRNLQELPKMLDSVREAIKKSKLLGKPLFLFLHHYICHDPYIHSPRDFGLKFADKKAAILPEYPQDIERRGDFKWLRENFWKKINLGDPEQKDRVVSLYDGGIYYSDHIFGELVKIFKGEKFYDNSIIILVSDHGEEFYEHKDKLHWRLFIETLHVPLICKFPDNKYGGSRIKEFVRTIDILPTLLDILQINSNNLIQGISFKPLVSKIGGYFPIIVSYSDEGLSRKEEVRFIKDGFVYSNQPSKGGREWLFDLKIDPAEQNNIISRSPETLKKMHIAAKDILEKDKKMRNMVNFENGALIEKDSELTSQLRSLGYAQ